MQGWREHTTGTLARKGTYGWHGLRAKKACQGSGCTLDRRPIGYRREADRMDKATDVLYD